MQFRISVLMVSLAMAGCGRSDLPDLAQVTGTVTQKGQPLANAIVTFTPKEGRPSRGQTDEQGKYRLLYTVDAPGALLGEHSVSVVQTTPDDADDADESNASAESLPPDATNGSLKQEVKAGSNEINLEF